MAGDGLEAAELLREVGEADGVVEDAVGPVVVGVGPAGDADDGQVLAVGARDGVEHAEAPDGERDGARPDAPRAGVTIGGVPGVELVAAADEAQPGLGDEVVQQRQVEVAGHGEHVADAHLDEAARQVPPERAIVGIPHLLPVDGADGGGGGVLELIRSEIVSWAGSRERRMDGLEYWMDGWTEGSQAARLL